MNMLALSDTLEVADDDDFVIRNLIERQQTCWAMSKVFLDNLDAHGLHDMGVEIQALQRAVVEVRKSKMMQKSGKKK